MSRITYGEIIEYYGPKDAHAFLRTIEAALHDKTNVIFIDREKRLHWALEALNANRMAA